MVIAIYIILLSYGYISMLKFILLFKIVLLISIYEFLYKMVVLLYFFYQQYKFDLGVGIGEIKYNTEFEIE
jgi:hypothetical protein